MLGIVQSTVAQTSSMDYTCSWLQHLCLPLGRLSWSGDLQTKAATSGCSGCNVCSDYIKQFVLLAVALVWTIVLANTAIEVHLSLCVWCFFIPLIPLILSSEQHLLFYITNLRNFIDHITDLKFIESMSPMSQGAATACSWGRSSGMIFC